MKDIPILTSDESFQRWISGQASVDENAKWAKWLDDSPGNRDLYEAAIEAWRNAQFRPAALPDIETAWQNLSDEIEQSGQNAAGLKPLDNASPLRYRYQPAHSSWARVAAIAVAVVLFIAVFAKYSSFLSGDKDHYAEHFQEVTTEYGQRVTISLPDGTKIILNANSTLRYPAVWSATATVNFDLRGEAYFSVAPRKNPKSKFVINTVDGTVAVIGTEFGIYERGMGTQVVVAKGRVEVTALDTSSLAVQPARVDLNPGQLLQFDKGSKNLIPAIVDVEPYLSWWQTKMVLVKTPFETIVRRLEETYGIVVRVQDQKLLKKTLSGSIENQNLVIVTDALAKALMVPVHRDGQTITFGKTPR